jgi:hypothetical protein
VDEVTVENGKTKVKVRKITVLIILILLLIPIVFSIKSFYFTDKIRIGIVMTSDELYSDCEIVKDKLNQFHDVFDARIVDLKFNESNVRIRHNLFLTNDYFDTTFAKKVRNRYNVDIILIVTNQSINNWLDDEAAIWGEAQTENSMAVFTARFNYDNSTRHKRYIQSTGLHEVLHLLGYEHSSICENCVTQYATYDTELCTDHKLELKYRASLWQLGSGHVFSEAVYLIKLTMHLIFSPIFLVIIIITYLLFKKFMYKQNKINLLPLILGFGFFYFNVVLVSILIAAITFIFIYLFSLVFLYVIFESISYEVLRRKNKEIEHNNNEP